MGPLGKPVSVNERYRQRQVEDRAELAVNRVFVGQLGEVGREAVGELLI
jgi:hypothetical protein